MASFNTSKISQEKKGISKISEKMNHKGSATNKTQNIIIIILTVLMGNFMTKELQVMFIDKLS